MTSIGVLNEGPLHASLKHLYTHPGDVMEAAVDGYLVDILRGDLIIEIQSTSFASIGKKMRDLVCRHRVRLVHPIAQERWIVKLPASRGGFTVRRKSPKKGGFEEICQELVSFPDLLVNKNFELEAVVTREEELRRFDGRRGRRRRGWVVVERRLVEVVDRMLIRGPTDLVALLPVDLPNPFQTSDLSSLLCRPRALAQKMAYCLRKCGVITVVGRDRNGILYQREHA